MSVQQSKLRSKISLSGGSSSSQSQFTDASVAEAPQDFPIGDSYQTDASYYDAGTYENSYGESSYDMTGSPMPDEPYGTYPIYSEANGNGADAFTGEYSSVTYGMKNEVPNYDASVEQTPLPPEFATVPDDANQKKKKIYKRASIAFLGVFIISGTLLALMIGTNWLKNKAYVDLSSDINIEMKDNTTDAKGMEKKITPSGRDWNALLSENGDLKYWMTVENKPIDYPLVQHPTDQNYYLKHDFWGGYDIAGTPFIDVRNYLSDKHLLTYGHHITGSTTMYSTVNKAWDPDEFAEIGRLTLESPTADGNTNYEVFYPAYAFMVDQSYQEIQTFDFDSDSQFRAWLQGMANEASAKNEHTDYLCRNAMRAVSFITCASDTPNQRERTIIMFISVAAPSTSYEDASFIPQDIAEVTSQAEQQIQQQQQAQQQQAQQQVDQSQQANQQLIQQQVGIATANQESVGKQQIATKLNIIGLLSHSPGTPLFGVPSSPLLEESTIR